MVIPFSKKANLVVLSLSLSLLLDSVELKVVQVCVSVFLLSFITSIYLSILSNGYRVPLFVPIVD